MTKRKPKINKDEELALENLFRKYRLSFKKMKLDIKSNIFQWTEHQCRFKVKEYVKKHGLSKLKEYLNDAEIAQIDAELDEN